MTGTPNAIGVEIVTLAKHGGVLSKHIHLSADGTLISDGSACVMGSGVAWRTEVPDMSAFAGHIATLGSREAIALGRLRDDLPGKVLVTTKAKLNGDAVPWDARPGDNDVIIARTGTFIDYLPGAPALLLIDIDHKGMPDAVRGMVKSLGGAAAAIARVVPGLGACGLVQRTSTTTGLSRTDTGETLPGSEGQHLYVFVADGADIERALRALHDRLWLAGCGWMMVGAAGQLLDRSLADRMVYAPERLVFESAPIIDPPLMQNTASRAPLVREGAPLDTATAIRDLTPVELVTLERLKAADRTRLAPDSAKARQAWINTRTDELVQRGVMPVEARQQAARAVDGGVLLPDFVLAFDLPEFDGCTVGSVIENPDRFVGATLADPQEGVGYGRGKAQIMQRPDGSLWIHSFAHGRAVYELKLDGDRLRERLAKVTDDNIIISTFVRLCRRMADVGEITQGRIRDELTKRLKIGKREFAKLEKAAVAKEDAADARARKEAQQRRRIEAGDLRPQFDKPAEDSPFHIVEAQLDAVFAASQAPEPPMRDLDGFMMDIRSRRANDLHELTARGANAEETKAQRLPAPEQVLMTRLTNVEVARAVEDHIDYIATTEDGSRSVRLPSVFVNGYRQHRFGSPLPIVSAVATMPLVLPDGTLLSGHYLDREREILFRVPPELETLMPEILDCTDDAVAESMHLLCDEWLVDVPTDYAGKLKLIALAGTILQRPLFPERPGWFIIGGQRGTGKTTAINMVSAAVTGQRMTAAAWSTSSEERRKGFLAYLGDGLPALCFDNITRGMLINDPHVDKILTGPTHTDRLLGFSEARTVPTFTVFIWTGNNIGPKGDTASRTLVVRLITSRPDPENRTVRHADPIAWTYANRGRILQAIYTVLLGNPRLRQAEDRAASPETRFKLWWHCIGAAVEHGAICHRDRFAEKSPACPPAEISFRDEFLANDSHDEQGHALAIALGLLRAKWPSGFTAADVVHWAYNTFGNIEAVDFQRAFFDAIETATGQKPPQGGTYSSRSLTWRLIALLDTTATVGGKVYALHRLTDDSVHGDRFIVAAVEDAPEPQQVSPA